MLYVIIYDIGDDRARERFSKFLQRWGLHRIQRSAFIGSMVRGRAKDIARYASTIISMDNDIVHIIPVERLFWNQALVIGSSRWSSGREVVVKA